MITVEQIYPSDSIEQIKEKLNNNFNQLANANGGHIGNQGLIGLSGIPGRVGDKGEDGTDGERGGFIYFYEIGGSPYDTPYNTVADAIADDKSIYDLWYCETNNTWYWINGDVWSHFSPSLTMSESLWKKSSNPETLLSYFKNTLSITGKGVGDTITTEERLKTNIHIGSLTDDNNAEYDELKLSKNYYNDLAGVRPEFYKIQLNQITAEEGGVATSIQLPFYNNSLYGKKFAPLAFFGESKIDFDNSTSSLFKNFGLQLYSESSSGDQILSLISGTNGVNNNHLYLGVKKLWTNGDINIETNNENNRDVRFNLVIPKNSSIDTSSFFGIGEFNSSTVTFQTPIDDKIGVLANQVGNDGEIYFKVKNVNYNSSSTKINKYGYLEINGNQLSNSKFLVNLSNTLLSGETQEMFKIISNPESINKSFIKYHSINDSGTTHQVFSSYMNVVGIETKISEINYKENIEIYSKNFREYSFNSHNWTIKMGSFGLGLNDYNISNESTLQIYGNGYTQRGVNDSLVQLGGFGIATENNQITLKTTSDIDVTIGLFHSFLNAKFKEDVNVDGVITTNTCVTISSDVNITDKLNSTTMANAIEYEKNSPLEVGLNVMDSKLIRYNDNGANDDIAWSLDTNESQKNLWKQAISKNDEGDIKMEHHEISSIPWFSLMLWNATAPLPKNWYKDTGRYVYDNTNFPHPTGENVEFVWIDTPPTAPSGFVYIIKLPMASGVYSGSPADGVKYIKALAPDHTMFPTLYTYHPASS